MSIENLLILTDEQLAVMAQEGSDTAEEILIEKYKGLVRAKAKAYFIIGAESEDVIQEGMIGLMKAIRNYDSEREAGFRTFANTCINNQILKAIKKADNEKSSLNDALSFSDRIGSSQEALTIGDVLKASLFDEPEEKVIYDEMIARLKEFGDKELSLLERQVLVEKLNGSTYTEIAEKLGKSPKTIDNAQQRLRKKIIGFLKL